MLASFALAQQRRKQDEELRQTMEQLSRGGSVWEVGCVGVVGVAMSFIKREFNDTGYCDEGKNGPDDSDVGGEDNRRSKCNSTVCERTKLRCSELLRGADADDMLADGGYGHGYGYGYGYGYGWRMRMRRARSGEWRVTGDRWRAQKTGSRWPVAGDG